MYKRAYFLSRVRKLKKNQKLIFQISSCLFFANVDIYRFKAIFLKIVHSILCCFHNFSVFYGKPRLLNTSFLQRNLFNLFNLFNLLILFNLSYLSLWLSMELIFFIVFLWLPLSLYPGPLLLRLEDDHANRHRRQDEYDDQHCDTDALNIGIYIVILLYV